MRRRSFGGPRISLAPTRLNTHLAEPLSAAAARCDPTGLPHSVLAFGRCAGSRVASSIDLTAADCATAGSVQANRTERRTALEYSNVPTSN